MSNLTLRMATTGDTDALARLAKKTFLDAFEAQNDPRNIRAYVAQAFSPAQMGLELLEENSRFFVIERNAELLAYAKVRDDKPPTEVRGDKALELQRIYVEHGHMGTGMGRMLLDATVAYCVGAGADVLWLGVWSKNPESIAFYRRCGFEMIGTKAFMMGQEVQEDHIMQLVIEHVYDVPSITAKLQS